MKQIPRALSSPDLIGRPSIPEKVVIEPKSRGVLDAPVKPGHDTVVEVSAYKSTHSRERRA